MKSILTWLLLGAAAASLFGCASRPSEPEVAASGKAAAPPPAAAGRSA